MILMDKGYYDYDYEVVESVPVHREKTDEELRATLAGFGIGTAPATPKGEEEMQDYILKQIKEA